MTTHGLKKLLSINLRFNFVCYNITNICYNIWFVRRIWSYSHVNLRLRNIKYYYYLLFYYYYIFRSDGYNYKFFQTMRCLLVIGTAVGFLFQLLKSKWSKNKKIKIELFKIQFKNYINTWSSYCLFKTVCVKVIIMFIAFPMRLSIRLKVRHVIPYSKALQNLPWGDVK